MKFFVKDICETMQARLVLFGKQVDNDVLYRGIANQPSHAYSSLHLSNFLSIFWIMNFYIPTLIKSGVYTGLQLSVVLFNELSICLSVLLYPHFEKVGGILVYICLWFRPSFLPSVIP